MVAKLTRPLTTLFMLMSLDGKITTGDSDLLDVDTDFAVIKGLKEGLWQYYEIEQTTDLYSLNSGRVMAKIGANDKKNIEKSPVSFLLIDNKPHLNETGVDNFIKKSKNLFIITTNDKHPAFKRRDADNLHIIFYKNNIDFTDLFYKLKMEYEIDKLTIQTGGTLNSVFLQNNLIDMVSVVVAPALVGGKNTMSLVAGNSIKSLDELHKIKVLKLIAIKELKHSYVQLIYKVLNETDIVLTNG